VAGTELLRRLAAEPGRAAVLLDVDGVLAPIVERPEDASVPPEARHELERLRGRYALVAAVTGRRSDDARRIVGVDGLEIVGEHGLELEPEAEAWVGRLDAFLEGVAWPAERKRLTASFHYRTHPRPLQARKELGAVAELASSQGLRPRWGRKVLEIRPPVDADKGTAVRRLLERHRLRRALYAGDDTTDLDAFRALDGLELSVRVAVASPEAPPELAAGADVVVPDPAALLELLREL
jgi:trehalose 6-phosphate phosphatase